MGENYKASYDVIQAAIDLCYPKEVIDMLRKAKTEVEKTRIMTTARKQDKEDKK